MTSRSLNISAPNKALLPLLVVAALLAGVLLPVSAPAAKKKSTKKTPAPQLLGKRKSKLIVGVADNNAPVFKDENYRALGTKITRKILAYDWWQYPDQSASLDEWMAGAESAGVEPLISFERSLVNPTKLPTVPEFKQSLSMLLAKYPNRIRVFSPWNEANHKSQPTVNFPKRAAEYYNASRQMCKGCKIIAADVLDQTNMLPWVKVFRRYAKKPTLWGLHSYTDSNRNKTWHSTGTKKLLSAVPGKVWLTEVGGIVAFNVTYAFDPQRAALATVRVLNMAQKVPRIERVYLYCWFGVSNPSTVTSPAKWDSGMVGWPDTTPRPAYHAVKDWLATH